ncbi:hypothetical protein J6TS7_28830 [Paenibacillus dendritiformis]|nr:hypothetical protein J6TS7_28830 [Paenibacillus dendritiformis]
MGWDEEEMTKRALEQFTTQRAAGAQPIIDKLNGIAARAGVEHDERGADESDRQR